jgi:hypothetical protein
MIAITGHTSGLGKSIYQKLYPNCIGFSRSNGYDINLNDSREKIMDQSKDCKYFINNASNDFGQSLVLLDFFSIWNNSKKVIINIGSKIAEDDYLIKSVENFHLLRYQMCKRHLKSLVYDLNQTKSSLTIQYISFGYIGTKKILKKYPTLTDFITVETASDLVLNSINLNRGYYE